MIGDSPIQGLPVHERAFGYWKLEHRFEEAFYNRPRQYGLRMRYDGVGEPKPDLIQVDGVPVSSLSGSNWKTSTSQQSSRPT